MSSEPFPPSYDADQKEWQKFYDDLDAYNDRLNDAFRLIPPFDSFYSCNGCGVVVFDRDTHLGVCQWLR